jgi:hypothetical protein
MNRRSKLSLGALFVLFAGFACSSTDKGAGLVARDGSPGGGSGTVSTGGSSGSGGVVSAGGSSGSGGVVSAGGSSGSGGVVSAAGASGSGGAISTGGKVGTGSGGAGGAGGRLTDGGNPWCMEGGTCNPLDGGTDARVDRSTPSDLPADRPSIDGSGDGLFVPGACSPAGSNGQLDMQAAGTLVVAPDEKHVAFLRDPRMIEAGCLSRGAQLELGTLVVLELQSDGSACQRVVAKDVSSSSVFFSSDSRYLAFMEGVDGCRVGKLKTADADGANVRLVQASASNDRGIGATVFFTVKDQDLDFAVPFAGGNPVALGARSDNPDDASNATGTAFAYENYESDQGAGDGALVLVALPSGKSQTLVDGAKEQVGISRWSTGGGWLAFCHGTKDPASSSSLTLVAADGGSRIEVSSNSACYPFTFSPDDAWLLYPEPDSSGGTRVLSYSLEDRSSVVLGVLPERDFRLEPSDDSASVVVTIGPKNSTSPLNWQVYAGTAGIAGSLRLLTDEPGVYDVVSAGGYLALSTDSGKSSPTGDWTVEVYPISGGTPVTIPGDDPHFEPGVAQPRLMLRQGSPGAIALAATDGSGVTAYPVSDSDYFVFAGWLGSAAVYGTRSDSNSLVTISALTSTGAVNPLLASEAGAYAWSPIAAPTRIFYSRKVASAGGAVGVFYAELPR